ncbi:GGDEF domain-containing protein [Mycobacterium sp. NS-7484]|uniref:GGDEF domain-containing protein n=1 Tax=Mycobacterium sp. NS-7484 TaxID=1834161 RepID=UPI001E49F8E2|nr:GGDEF domain-containing protein [Mycobacterium sp. NS-7484]
MPRFGEVLRHRMLLSYLAILLVLYLLAAVTSLGRDDARGEWIAVVLCGLGLVVAGRGPIVGPRYLVVLGCAAAAPVAALLTHRLAVAQVWSLIPLMFLAVLVRSWHRPSTARVIAALLAAASVAALLIAPAVVPALWLLLFTVSIVGAAEVLGLLHAALLDAALRDPLTSVWNRTGVEREVENLAARARRRGEMLAVILLDIDDFKSINDQGGHAAGDHVLVQLARSWRSRLPGSAVLGRLGGDEFVAVTAGLDAQQAAAMADDLANLGPVYVSTGLSVGPPGDIRVFARLMESADRSLYQRKRQRKGII